MSVDPQPQRHQRGTAKSKVGTEFVVEQELQAAETELARLLAERSRQAQINNDLQQQLAHHASFVAVPRRRIPTEQVSAERMAEALAAALTICRGLEDAPLLPEDVRHDGLPDLPRYWNELVASCTNKMARLNAAGGDASVTAAISRQVACLLLAAAQYALDLASTERLGISAITCTLHRAANADFGVAPLQTWPLVLAAMQLEPEQKADLMSIWRQYKLKYDRGSAACGEAAVAISGRHQDTLASNAQRQAADFGAAVAQLRTTVSATAQHEDFLYDSVSLLSPVQCARAIVTAKPWVPDMVQLCTLLSATSAGGDS